MVEVETFEINEIANEVTSDADSLALIEKLGLEGQDKLKSSDGMNLCPYQQVNKGQEFTITTLCPQRYTIKEYSRGQIPLRILQVISHVLDGEYFEEIYIYDRADTTIKDPFLIGKRKDMSTSYSYDYFLLGRWGSELEAWSELAKKAKVKAAENYAQYIAETRTALAQLEVAAKNGIYRTEYFPSYTESKFN